jgi:hypothetical protein
MSPFPIERNPKDAERSVKFLFIVIAFAGILYNASLIGNPAWGILPYVGLVVCGGMIGFMWKLEA